MTVEGLLALALTIGIGRADFVALTPEEFREVFALWRENQQAQFRDGWERTRTVAAAALVPHSKKRSLKAIFPLPWDDEKKTDAAPVPKLTKAERAARIEELTKKWQ
jgi:dihydrodipicolinate synthase/N-acetylneuraminate lyase